ncbi:MAG TPA: SIMPL domain-containing protein [Candidatus Paceibacterota bacterium]|nr:SIMPL domain-containing protein [Candidatus Paceibacterota bacterium]
MNQFLTELQGNRAIRLALLAVFVLLALFLLVMAWKTAFGYTAGEPYNTITVEGTGEAVAVPDIAQITFTVTESSANVAEAQEAATAKTDEALEYLTSQGIEANDVKTQYYNVSPRYTYDSVACGYGMPCPPQAPRITGYDVSQSIQVKVRDIAKAGDILGGLGSIGVQNISGPNFIVDDEDAVRAEAREAAIDEAREKARALSSQLGVRLGKVMSFYENTGAYPMYSGYEARGGAMDAMPQSAPTLPVGENETSVSVSITYEIK